MMAIAWSYAACVHFGVLMLQWTGMALERKSTDNHDAPVYPKMLKWLRD
jgi:hypothetical protein